MRTVRVGLAVTTLLAFSGVVQSAPRLYLSVKGDDTNICSVQAPCRTLNHALPLVDNGGELWILDSGNFNTASVTINKSVSILAVPGAVGSIASIAGPAISISADSLSVALRNIVIVPLVSGGGTDGIVMTGRSVLVVESSLIANVPGTGITVSGVGVLMVTNSIIRNCGNVGLELADGARGTFTSVQLLRNGKIGLGVWTNDKAPGAVATISDSAIVVGAGADSFGVAASGFPNAVSRVTVTRTTIDGALYGIYLAGTSEVSLSGTTVANNEYAWSSDPEHNGIVFTYGNNQFVNNTYSSGPLTAVAQQ